MIFIGVVILLELLSIVGGQSSGDDVAPTVKDTLHCERGWSNRSAICVKLFTDAENYTQAEAMCRMHGSHLVSIHEAGEHAHVLSLLLNVKEAWIGLSDRITEGVYKWEDGMQFSTYSSWELNALPFSRDDELDPETGIDQPLKDCVSISGHNGRWKNHRCSKKMPYVCEKNADLPVEVSDNVRECGSEEWVLYNGHCYLFKNKPLLASREANAYCRSQNSTLVTIQNPNENAFIFSQIHAMSTSRFSIGLTDKKTEGLFTWVTGEPVKFTWWGTKEPNSYRYYNEDCTEIFATRQLESGFWNDVPCSKKEGYICEKSGGTKLKKPQPAPNIHNSSRECLPGWILHKSMGSSYCYKFDQLVQWNWTDARDDCRRRYGADLISLHSPNEMNFVKMEMLKRGITSLWIGLSEYAYEEKFVWSDDSAGSFFKWNRIYYSPNRDCVKMMTTKSSSTKTYAAWWFKFDCKTELRFGCKMSLGHSQKRTRIASPVFPSPSHDSLRCPTNWIRHSDTCYLFVFAPMDWKSASKTCAGQGSTLISVRTKRTQDFISDYLYDHNSILSQFVWIGLSDLEKEHDFKWKNGAKLSFTQWAINQPEYWKYHEDCVVLRNARYWYDVSCNENNGYICEKPAEKQVTIDNESFPSITDLLDETKWQLPATTSSPLKREEKSDREHLNLAAAIVPSCVAIVVIFAAITIVLFYRRHLIEGNQQHVSFTSKRFSCTSSLQGDENEM
eukprot:m.7540 g.7540  ORF g.7540 m.7540 type:complete len:730 (+) comp18949_c0_seq1:36-2225(+)